MDKFEKLLQLIEKRIQKTKEDTDNAYYEHDNISALGANFELEELLLEAKKL